MLKLKSFVNKTATLGMLAVGVGVAIQSFNSAHAEIIMATAMNSNAISPYQNLASDPSFSSIWHPGTDAGPIPTNQDLNDNSPIIENMGEMSVKQVAAYLQKTAEEEALQPGASVEDFARIQLDPSQDIGKIIIKVHKAPSSEYLEVFKQNSANPDDLSPVNIFENNSTNSAKVSTAGTYSGKTYPTPDGDFQFDRFETMHHSSTYNDAPMPFSMFFNRGIAIHAATPGEYKDLGRPASHGCVRTHLDTAQALFTYLEKLPLQNGHVPAVVEILGSALPNGG